MSSHGIGVLLIALATVPPSMSAAAWYMQTVDHLSADEVSLALDQTGYPRLAYRSGASTLGYTRWNGTAWASEPVSSAANYVSGAWLMLDGSDNAIIAYRAITASWSLPRGGISYSHGIDYARRDGNSWISARLYGDLAWAYQAFFAFVDSSGKAQLLMDTLTYADSTRSLREAIWSSNSWSQTNLYTWIDQEDGLYPQSFAAGEAGYRCILSLRAGALYFVEWQENLRSSVLLDSTVTAASVALDGAGHAHAVWTTESGLLKYGMNTTGAWSSQTVATGARYASVALDQGGYPHVAFVTTAGFPLKYARKAGTSWITEDIPDFTSISNSWCSLKMDRATAPHIAYLGTNGGLNYATKSSNVSPPDGTVVNMLFSNSKFLADDWWWSAWLGFFSSRHYPWIYHNHLGFLYCTGNSTDDIWLYDLNLGWLWTSSRVYPFLYSHQRSSWLWYQRGSTNPRWFADLSTGQWLVL